MIEKKDSDRMAKRPVTECQTGADLLREAEVLFDWARAAVKSMRNQLGLCEVCGYSFAVCACHPRGEN
jgi:hypothetical protein